MDGFGQWTSSGKSIRGADYIGGTGHKGDYNDLIDMNRDGLLDRVGHHDYRTGIYGIYVALNIGMGFREFKLWMPSDSGQHPECYIRGSDFIGGTKYKGDYNDLIDMNGDGLADRVGHYNYNTYQHGIHVAFGKAVKPVIISIKNSLQMTTSIKYKLLTDSDIYTKSSSP